MAEQSLLASPNADTALDFQVPQNFYASRGFCSTCEECKETGAKLFNLSKETVSLFEQYCDYGHTYFSTQLSVKKTLALSGSDVHRQTIRDAFSTNVNLQQANYRTSHHFLPQLVRVQAITEEIDASFALCRLTNDGMDPQTCLLQLHSAERQLQAMVDEAGGIIQNVHGRLASLTTAITFISLIEDPRRSSRVKDKLDAEAQAQQHTQHEAWTKLRDSVALASYSQISVSNGGSTDGATVENEGRAMEDDTLEDDVMEDDVMEDDKEKDVAVEDGATSNDVMEGNAGGEAAVEHENGLTE